MTQTADAVNLLRELTEEHDLVPVTLIKRSGKDLGISWWCLREAKQRLNLVSVQQDGDFFWRRPNHGETVLTEAPHRVTIVISYDAFGYEHKVEQSAEMVAQRMFPMLVPGASLDMTVQEIR